MSRYGSYGNGYREYVPVKKRLANGRSVAQAIAKAAGREVAPVKIIGSAIAKTFWGKAWCSHMEQLSDFRNRLPRGRTYARNGSVVDLHLSEGKIDAIVAGTDTYEIEITIQKLKPDAWKKIRKGCSTSIDSVLDLLGGRFSDGAMKRLTDKKNGMFPLPREMALSCDCPDAARLCKHLAAVLYGVGAHLDSSPELLFLLRGVDYHELIGEAVSGKNLDAALGAGSNDLAAQEDLGALFGIELSSTGELEADASSTAKKKAVKKQAVKKKAVKKKAVKKKAVKKKAVKKQAVKKKAVKKKAVKKKAVQKKAVQKKAAKK